MKNLFLVRHGQSTSNNLQNRIEKLPDHKVYLSDIGREQAHDCGIFLKEYFDENKLDYDSTIMFNSPFIRTRQTSDIINETLNIKNRREEPFLIEHQYGLFSDTAFEVSKEKFPQFYAYYDNFYRNEGKFYVRMPMGESGVDVYTRSYLFLDKLNKYYNDYDNVLVISHGNVIKTILMHIVDYPPEWFAYNKPSSNCEVTLIDEEKKMKILRK